jgi:plasmid stability protein
VRTTLNLDDTLYRELKVRAAQEGVTLTSVIEDALRDHLRRRVTRQADRVLPVLRQSGGVRPGVDLADNRAVVGILDEDDSVITARP